MYQAKKYFT